jgi:hypothetical protein
VLWLPANDRSRRASYPYRWPLGGFTVTLPDDTENYQSYIRELLAKLGPVDERLVVELSAPRSICLTVDELVVLQDGSLVERGGVCVYFE